MNNSSVFVVQLGTVNGEKVYRRGNYTLSYTTNPAKAYLFKTYATAENRLHVYQVNKLVKLKEIKEDRKVIEIQISANILG